MQVYQTDAEGAFVGVVVADPSPLEPEVWLIPAGCVEAAPPEVGDGQMARWRGGVWVIENTPVAEIEPKLTPEELAEQVKGARILELIQLLRDTDYVALPDYDKDKPDVLAQRQAWRNEIRALGG